MGWQWREKKIDNLISVSSHIEHIPIRRGLCVTLNYRRHIMREKRNLQLWGECGGRLYLRSGDRGTNERLIATSCGRYVQDKPHTDRIGNVSTTTDTGPL